MKLTVSTFLVYKVKKCLLKSGKVNRQGGVAEETALSKVAQALGIVSPPFGHRLPKAWASCPQALVLPYCCSFLYLVDYIVPYSYCKLTIIFSIPNSTCQSSILFLVSIYILYLSLALPPFYEEWMCLLWRLRAVLYED